MMGIDVSSWPLVILLLHLAGWASALHVIHTDRSTQGTVGWALALIFISPLSVPFYWVFGGRRYKGYRLSLQRAMASHHEATEEVFKPLQDHAVNNHPACRVLKRLTLFPLTRDNTAKLLIDGEATFSALFSALEQADDYILAEFFTIEDDQIGNRFLDLLVAKAQAGVRVHVLYDLLGSTTLHRKCTQKLRRQGVHIRPFRSPRFPSKYLHFNFRNHRKICVVDGKAAFVGGFNIGDDYLGKHSRLSPWRDTHLRLTGPSVAMLQAVFMADWHWTTGEQLKLQWNATSAQAGTAEVAFLPTGPADKRDTCILFLLAMIREANERIWITTPYLVPPDAIVAALESAAKRGVDVRIITTSRADHYVSFLAGKYFAEQLRQADVRVFRYTEGFLHEKVILIDQVMATVGTMNIDPRSLYLNFEATAVLTDRESVEAVARMLQADFENSHRTTLEWAGLHPLERSAACVCRLFAPLL